MATRRSARRAEKDSSAADGRCWLCNGVTSMDDHDWLCLCTAEKQRVHKVCATQRSSLGGPTLRPCPHCGMGNSAGAIEHARASSRVVIVGAGAAGLAAARWLKARGLNRTVTRTPTPSPDPNPDPNPIPNPNPNPKPKPNPNPNPNPNPHPP